MCSGRPSPFPPQRATLCLETPCFPPSGDLMLACSTLFRLEKLRQMNVCFHVLFLLVENISCHKIKTKMCR